MSDVEQHPPLAGLNDKIDVKAFFERVLVERNRLDEEREKRLAERLQAAERALRVAEQEREKSALALREQLAMRIEAGDSSLRDHITAQVSQIKALVQSTETLALTRLEAVRNEQTITFDAAQKAIEKAENALNERVALLNEFRGQAADDSKMYVKKEQLDGLAKEVTRIDTSVARLYGGLLVIALVGIANLVKVFAG